MKKFKLSNLIPIALLLFLIATRGPTIYQNFKNQGQVLSELNFLTIDSEKVRIDENSGKKIFVFWATWCPPCRLELSRYHNAFKNNEISLANIYFINMQEGPLQIRKYLKKNEYQFKVITDLDGRMTKLFSVQLTPTTIHLDNQKIEFISSGLSPLSIYLATSFLK